MTECRPRQILALPSRRPEYAGDTRTERCEYGDTRDMG